MARGQGFLALHESGVGAGWVSRLPLATVEPARAFPRHHPVHRQPLTYECHSFGELPEEAIGVLFKLGLGGRPVRREPFGDAPSIWGTAKAVEFVITPTVGDSAHSHLYLGTPSGLCPACSEPVWGGHCPFCRVAPARANLPATPPPPPPPPVARHTGPATPATPATPAPPAPPPPLHASPAPAVPPAPVTLPASPTPEHLRGAVN